MYPFRGQVLKRPNIGVHVVRLSDGYEPVISYFVFTVQLFAFHHSNQASANRNPRERGLIHQQQYVDWIAIRREGLRQKSKIIGKCHSGRQNLLQREDSLVRIEGELIPTPSRRLNDDLEKAVLFIDRL